MNPKRVQRKSHAVFRSSVLLALTLISTPSFAESAAEDAYVLHEKAVAARERGEYERAERLFRESLAAHDLNITWLNLGQLLGVMGRCEDARHALDRVPAAEAVEAPSRAEVLEVLAKRRAALDKECEEAPTNATVVIEPIERPVPETRRVPLVPWILTGVGAGGLVTALIIDQAVLPSKFEALQRLQGGSEAEYEELERQTRGLKTGNLILAAASTTAVVAGALLLVFGESKSVAIAPAGSGSGLSVVFRVRLGDPR